MSDQEHFLKSIEALRTKLAEQERASNKTKSTINDLCELAGLQVEFPDVGEISSTGATANTRGRSIESQIKKGDFFGRPLQTCIKKVLELRQSIGEGPTEVKEIYRLLNLGDYEFNTRDSNNAITGLWVSISKNSQTFVKLPSGLVGLADWYPDKPKQRKKISENGNAVDEAQIEDAPQSQDEKSS